MTPGKLIRFPFENAILLGATPNEWSWKEVSRGYLLCLEEMDMTREWATAAAVATCRTPARAAKAAAAATAGAAAWAGAGTARADPWQMQVQAEYDKIYDLALKEFEKTERIKGYKFLCPEGNNYIWLSYYDVEFLKNYTNE